MGLLISRDCSFLQLRNLRLDSRWLFFVSYHMLVTTGFQAAVDKNLTIPKQLVITTLCTLKVKGVRRPWSDQIFSLYTLKSYQKSVTKPLVVLSLKSGELSAPSCSQVSGLVHCPLGKAKPAEGLLLLPLLSVIASHLPTSLNANFILYSGILGVAHIHVAWIFFKKKNEENFTIYITFLKILK